MSAPGKKIFVVGFEHAPPAGSEEIKAAAGTPEELHEKAVEQFKKMKEAGHDVVVHQFSSKNLDAALEGFRGKLREKDSDGVIIGFGVRGVPAYTLMFENMVNSVRKIVPNAKFEFNTTPKDTFEAVVRLAG